MIGRGWVIAALLVVGCSRPEPEATNADANVTASSTGASNEVANAVDQAAGSVSLPSGYISQFTSNDLKKCRLIEKNEEEGGYYRHRCPGAGGFGYEHVESDLRQSLVILAPGGRRGEVALSAVAGGGGFSTIGPTFDWRGPAGQPPRTVTIRFNVNESPEPKVPPTSYLVVIRLAAPACPVQAVPPGPKQSEQARAIADRKKLPPCAGN